MPERQLGRITWQIRHKEEHQKAQKQDTKKLEDVEDRKAEKGGKRNYKKRRPEETRMEKYKNLYRIRESVRY